MVLPSPWPHACRSGTSPLAANMGNMPTQAPISTPGAAADQPINHAAGHAIGHAAVARALNLAGVQVAPSAHEAGGPAALRKALAAATPEQLRDALAGLASAGPVAPTRAVDALTTHTWVEIVELMDAGVAVFGPDDRLRWCNSFFRKLYPALDSLLVPGVHVDDTFVALYRSGVRLGDRHLTEAQWLAQVHQWWREDRIMPSDRLVGDRWIRSGHYRTASGYTVMMRVDITAEHEAQAALVQQQALLRSALQGMESGLAIYDQDDRLIECNQRFKDLYPTIAHVLVPGSTVEQGLRALFHSGVEISDQPVDEQAWMTASLARWRQSDTVTERRVGPRLIRAVNTRTPEGLAVALRTDVTPLKQLAIDLDNTWATMRSAIDAIPDGFALFDGDHRLVMANAAYGHFLPAVQHLLKPGVSMHELLRALYQAGSMPQAAAGANADQEDTWVQAALQRWLTTTAPYDRPQGDRWIRRTNTRMANGYTVAMRSDVTELHHPEPNPDDRPGAGRSQQPGQKRFFGHHESRTPHPLERRGGHARPHLER
jgi:PAS domain-containing protein